MSTNLHDPDKIESPTIFQPNLSSLDGYTPLFYTVNGRRPQLFCKWKTTLFGPPKSVGNWRTTSINFEKLYDNESLSKCSKNLKRQENVEW
jgi:hypothetical protein